MCRFIVPTLLLIAFLLSSCQKATSPKAIATPAKIPAVATPPAPDPALAQLRKEVALLRDQLVQVQSQRDEAFQTVKAWNDWFNKQKNQPNQNSKITKGRSSHSLLFSTMKIGMSGHFDESIHDFRVEEVLGDKCVVMTALQGSDITAERYRFALKLPPTEGGKRERGFIGNKLPGIFKVISTLRHRDGTIFFILELIAKE